MSLRAADGSDCRFRRPAARCRLGARRPNGGALSWASLFYMAVEGGVGVWQGVAASSIALVGWGLASFIEGIASAVIVWRFTGARRLSDTAEGRAQKLVAVQFFILAPYVLVESTLAR